MELPKDPYDRILNQEEYQRLLNDGWRTRSPQPCDRCYGRGCDACHFVGLVSTLWKGNRYYFGTPIISEGNVGARCTIHYFPGQKKIGMQFIGGGGEAKVSFYYNQLFSLMKMCMDCICAPNVSRNEEFGVEGEFRGPPVTKLAALTKARITISTTPNERQRMAIKTLNNAGFVEEAKLLHAAFEHEVFRGDQQLHEETRAAVGNIKPGTIFNRKRENVVVGNGEVINLDSDGMVLSKLR